MTYQEFIEGKIISTPKSGFTVYKQDIHPILFPHQNDIVRWALDGGKRAIFASFGLGKSIMQLEIARQIVLKENKPFLIVTDLGIKQEFQRDAKLIGIDDVRYIKTDADFEAAKNETQFFITNYERIRNGNINPSHFVGVTLDEAAVLRGYGTETYQQFLPLFQNMPYKFVATATPAPNRYKELIHYAGFLGVMDTGQALTRFFQRDSTKSNNLTIYPHKEQEFNLWLSSWAIFLQKPSDLGYSDLGYALPTLKIIPHCVKITGDMTRFDSWGQGEMFRDAAVSLKDAAAEKRDSIFVRLEKAIEVIGSNEPNEHWLLWHHLEDERRAIEKAIPEAKTVYGSQTIDEKENLIVRFSNGDYRILATKPEIAGAGCNFQRHCSKAIFMGINYSFHDLIQAVHRIYRFMQKNDVEIHIIFTEGEDSIWKALQEKWQEHEILTDKMSELIRELGLATNPMSEIKRGLGVQRQEQKGDFYKIINNDCVQETAQMAENSVDMILTSIPFSNHYEYSPNFNDFGHTNDDAHFFAQMDFLIPQLHRVLSPGRVAAIHVKDRVMFGNVTGLGRPTINPFHMKTAFAFMKHGFNFFGQITITTDVVRENNQTYRLGHSENAKDSSKMGVGCPEYLLLFFKTQTDTTKGYSDKPVTKDKKKYTLKQWQLDAHALWRSSGNRDLTPEDLADMDMKRIQQWWKSYKNNEVYDYKKHIEFGRELEKNGRLPKTFMLFDPAINTNFVWSDISRMRTLNSEQKRKNEENHICPLQFDIVERAIERWSNEGDVIFDPFAGIGTVPKIAVEMGRHGLGTELNPNYWDCARRYCFEAEHTRKMPTLFDLIAFEKEIENEDKEVLVA